MLVNFFDSREIVHEEFVPLGQTANEEFHAEVLPRLFKESVEDEISFKKGAAGSFCMTVRDLTLRYQ
jgi:hypothetical protein